jgi:Tfp pilus assembly major pilin PilA
MYSESFRITLVLGRISYSEFINPGVTAMQEKQTALVFIEMFVVVAILGILSAVAIPHVGQMIYKSKAEASYAELHNIQTAVTEMLCDSNAGTLEPVGPVNDLKQVKTRDPQPLILADYLMAETNYLKSGCLYCFTADGTVMQMMH